MDSAFPLFLSFLPSFLLLSFVMNLMNEVSKVTGYSSGTGI
jgi:hypothetical protein